MGQEGRTGGCIPRKNSSPVPGSEYRLLNLMLVFKECSLFYILFVCVVYSAISCFF